MILNDLDMLIVNYQWYHNEKMNHYVLKYQLNSIEEYLDYFSIYSFYLSTPSTLI